MSRSNSLKHEVDFNNDGSSSSSNSQQVHKLHPDAYHKSRILDEEIAKSKSFKSYTSNDDSLNDLGFNSLLLNAEGEIKIPLLIN